MRLKQRLELSFKERRIINFILLVTLNLLATVVFIIGFTKYIDMINTQEENRNIESIENTIDVVVDAYENYLVSQHRITSSYASYIDRSNMSVQDAANYLFVWKDYYKAISIIDTETYRGIALAPNVDRIIEDYDYSLYRWATKVCKEYRDGKLAKKPVNVTDVFLDLDDVTYDLAFYAPIECEGKQYMIFFVFDTDSLKTMGSNVKGINDISGILVNRTGKILVGELPGIKDAIGMNFFEYFDGRGGIITSELIKKNVKASGKYTYRVTDSQNTGDSYVCLAQLVPNTDGWIYIYNASSEEYGANPDVPKVAKVFLVCLIIWISLVLLFFTLYNMIIKRYFEIIEKQNVDLEYASKAKTVFVSNVSHELRTPINAILGMNEMILKESKEEGIKDYAYDIRSAGKTLLSVINDVLDFSKIESGKMEIVETEYSLKAIVKDVYTLIQLKAEGKGLDFVINMSEDVPTTLIGDDVRIRQILVNLLTNAVKYTDKGHVTLRIDCEKVNDDAKLLVSVDDTGIGMKPEEMDKLYEEYGRLDMKKNHNTEGTGLGVPIVRKLLVMMGSELKVESTYGVGSRFYFDLTQKVSDWTKVGALNLLEKKDGREAAENSEKVKAATGRILAVDDTALNIKVLKALLKDTNLVIDSCDGGLRALKMCDSVKYDLIFLDHRMPGMDGIETIHRLKETSIMNKETPVIALTANVVSGAREAYIAEGFVDFLSKPINIAELNATIERYLGDEE